MSTNNVPRLRSVMLDGCQSPFLTISQNSFSYGGRLLWCALLKEHTSRMPCVVLTDSPSTHFLKLSDRIVVADCINLVFEEVLALIKNTSLHYDRPVSVFVEAIDCLLIGNLPGNYPSHEMAALLLHKIGSILCVHRVVVLHDRELSATVDLDYIASTNLECYSNNQNTGSFVQGLNAVVNARISHRKRSKLCILGKPICEDITITVDSRTLEIIAFAKTDPGGNTVSEVAPSSSFRLDLSPSEEAARTKVTMPHIILRKERASEIRYIPDALDDFDEDDPDSDLNI
ncbi:unnamed protein product [Protopolystoma xenopodis]|uniref:Elongator complex protein 5 n=1 Tax=Protopolystoma xenopodis TaxID=117903 RepID=A0A448XIR7_9PLAT|nr:unnamed protein product [Protopolystoma xenopodis]